MAPCPPGICPDVFRVDRPGCPRRQDAAAARPASGRAPAPPAASRDRVPAGADASSRPHLPGIPVPLQGEQSPPRVGALAGTPGEWDPVEGQGPGPEGASSPFRNSLLVPRDMCAPPWGALLLPTPPPSATAVKGLLFPTGGDSSFPSPEGSQSCTRGHQGLDSWSWWEEEGVPGREHEDVAGFYSAQPLASPHPHSQLLRRNSPASSWVPSV